MKADEIEKRIEELHLLFFNLSNELSSSVDELLVVGVTSGGTHVECYKELSQFSKKAILNFQQVEDELWTSVAVSYSE